MDQQVHAVFRHVQYCKTATLCTAIFIRYLQLHGVVQQLSASFN
jgi:hypothetical protein